MKIAYKKWSILNDSPFWSMIDSRKRGNSFIKKHFLADSTLSRAFSSVQQTSNMSMECNYNYRFKHRTQSLLVHLDCLSFERLKEKNLYLISQEVIYAGLYIQSKYVGRPKFNVAPVAVPLTIVQLSLQSLFVPFTRQWQNNNSMPEVTKETSRLTE